MQIFAVFYNEKDIFEKVLSMLKDLILNFKEPQAPESFLIGLKLPDQFELPDSILVFMHDWFPNHKFVHTRYMLIIPAVPIEYMIDNDVHYRIQPGQAFFSIPCQNRSLQPTYGDMERGYPRLMITFELSRAMYYLPDNFLLNITPQAEKYLQALLDAYQNQQKEDLSIQLFYLLRELSLHQSQEQPLRYSREVKKALNYIHYNLDASLQDIARFVNTSVSNLRFKFKNEIGLPPGEFIADYRMKIAKYNLATTDKRIDELAELCGFQSGYAFSHFFKKHTGLSPLAWRKENKSD